MHTSVPERDPLSHAPLEGRVPQMDIGQATGRQTALALSGGGYRAMLFHLGAVARLNELGLLVRLDRISSVSGGSLLAGRLAVCWKELSFIDGVATNFNEK